jgi:hypothetical protein
MGFRGAGRVCSFGVPRRTTLAGLPSHPACHRIRPAIASVPSSHPARHRIPPAVASGPLPRRTTAHNSSRSRPVKPRDRSAPTVRIQRCRTTRRQHGVTPASVTAWRTRLGPAVSCGRHEDRDDTRPVPRPMLALRPRSGSSCWPRTRWLGPRGLLATFYIATRHDDRSSDRKSTRSTDFRGQLGQLTYLPTPTPSPSCGRYGPRQTSPHDESPAKPAHSSTGSQWL